jgi:hypothetical protein
MYKGQEDNGDVFSYYFFGQAKKYGMNKRAKELKLAGPSSSRFLGTPQDDSFYLQSEI